MVLPIVNAEYIGKSVHDHKIGIIDIGSNSVRLVVFDGVRRTPLPIYNEKAFCALGKKLGDTGRLNEEGVETAKNCIARFLLMARLMEVVELHILATAAVRDASDGKEFVDYLEKKHGVTVTIISGKKEARLAAMGVLSSFYQPQGLAGDLGGGSMELVRLHEGALTHQVTMPIGPLRLMENGKPDREKMRRVLKKHFDEQEWVSEHKAENFYAIGGSFRAISKINMARTNYPLKILHHYTVPAAELNELLEMMVKMSPEEISHLSGASSRRAPALIPASMILQQVIESAEVKNIVFSASGIREGFMYEKLSPYVQKDDALLSSAADCASQSGRVAGYARELFDWMTPLMGKETHEQERLRLAACILSEIAWRIHPEYRGEWIYASIMDSPLVGLSHKERIFMATALYHRHQFKQRDMGSAQKLLNDETKARARVIGTAANLAYHLSGAITGNLSRTKVTAEKSEVKLFLSEQIQELMGDSVKKRLDGLGEALRLFSSISK